MRKYITLSKGRLVYLEILKSTTILSNRMYSLPMYWGQRMVDVLGLWVRMVSSYINIFTHFIVYMRRVDAAILEGCLSELLGVRVFSQLLWACLQMDIFGQIQGCSFVCSLLKLGSLTLRLGDIARWWRYYKLCNSFMALSSYGCQVRCGQAAGFNHRWMQQYSHASGEIKLTVCLKLDNLPCWSCHRFADLQFNALRWHAIQHWSPLVLQTHTPAPDVLPEPDVPHAGLSNVAECIPGSLKRIYLENFMCRALPLPFHSRKNLFEVLPALSIFEYVCNRSSRHEVLCQSECHEWKEFVWDHSCNTYVKFLLFWCSDNLCVQCLFENDLPSHCLLGEIWVWICAQL